MMMALALPRADNRVVAREDVHYRARAFGPDAKHVPLLIVNLSAMGLMARADLSYAIGDRLHIALPVIGVVVAEIRWSLGGRVGCELDRPIDLADYYDMLAVMLRQR